MTADEIRKIQICGEWMGPDELSHSGARSLDDCAQFLREIAAQLAEMNARAALKVPEEANG